MSASAARSQFATVRKDIYFARHGQTPSNAAEYFQPLDEPLSTLGASQAVILASRFARLELDAVVSSTLTRARQTAEPVTVATGLQAEFSDLFVERIKPSSLSGKPFSDQAADKLWQRWVESLFSDECESVEDGENKSQVLQRIDSALEFLLKHPRYRIGVITHGFFLRMLLCRVLLGDKLTGELLRTMMSRFAMHNTGISRVTYQVKNGVEGWHLHTHNDLSHLG